MGTVFKCDRCKDTEVKQEGVVTLSKININEVNWEICSACFEEIKSAIYTVRRPKSYHDR